MTIFRRLILAAATLVLCTSLANAATITTTFVSDNIGNGNMFDVTTAGNAVRITSLSVHSQLDAGTQTVSLYTRAGSYAGNELLSVGWDLRASILVNNAATPILMDVTDFELAANTTTGFYVVGTGWIAYTDGVFSLTDGDLTLSGGVGIANRNGPHFLNDQGTVFSPRTWNGSITYTVLSVPEPSSAMLLVSALGVLAAARRRRFLI